MNFSSGELIFMISFFVGRALGIFCGDLVFHFRSGSLGSLKERSKATAANAVRR
jgi:hypothetical protein